MKILKSYDRPNEFKFTCKKCGCEFIADIGEVEFVELVEYPEGVFYDKTNDPTAREIRCQCPDCLNMTYTYNEKPSVLNKEKKIDINLRVLYMSVISLIFFCNIFAFNKCDDEEMAKLSLVYFMINTVSAICYEIMNSNKL